MNGALPSPPTNIPGHELGTRGSSAGSQPGGCDSLVLHQIFIGARHSGRDGLVSKTSAQAERVRISRHLPKLYTSGREGRRYLDKIVSGRGSTCNVYHDYQGTGERRYGRVDDQTLNMRVIRQTRGPIPNEE